MAHEPFSRPTRIARTGLISSSAVSILVSIYGVEYQGFDNWAFHNAAPASLLPIAVVLVTLYFLISFAIYCADDLKNAEDPNALARAKALKKENDRLVQEIAREVAVARKYLSNRHLGDDSEMEINIGETIKHLPLKARQVANLDTLYLTGSWRDVKVSASRDRDSDRNIHDLAAQTTHVYETGGPSCFDIGATSFVELRECFHDIEAILDATKEYAFQPEVGAPKVTLVRTYGLDLALPLAMFGLAFVGWFGGLDWVAGFLPD